MKRYYKTCLWSPIWFPALLGLLAIIMESLWNRTYDALPPWIAIPAVMVFYSLVLGSVQYLIALFLVWQRIDFEEFRSWLKWVLLLPLIYTPIQIGAMLLVVAWRFDRLGDWVWVGHIAGFDLVLGYAYVAVWLVGYWLIRLFQDFTKRREMV